MKHTSIQNIEYWYETITAYKQGELSEQQIQELLRWKAERIEHAAFFEEVEKVWSISRETITFPEFNTEGAWNAVKAQTIDIQQPIQKTIWNQLSEAPFARAAAAIVVLATVTWTMSKLMGSKDTFTDLKAFEGVKEFYLPDSSKVYLHDSTTLRYASSYGKDERMVFLDGEAFFQVRKNASKPFTVLSYRSRVIVKGTSFSVLSRLRDSLDIIEVEEGKVAVLEKYSRSGEELMLTKGMQASVDIYGGLHKSNELISNPASWRNKERMIFIATPLKQVLQDLKAKTNTVVILEDKLAESCRFTGEFDNTNPVDILQVIALSMNMQVEKDGDTFILKGSACK
jgi:transmembrane sensor